MRTVAWIAGIAVAFTIGLNIRPTINPVQYETIVRTDTIHQASTAEQLRDVLIRIDRLNPDLDPALAFECIVALIQQTGDDLGPAIIYIERRYQGDSCKALEIYQTKGYY